MRGLHELHETNENPHHRSDEIFGGRRTDSADVNRSFESNLADKMRREQGHPTKDEALVAGLFADFLGGLIVDQAINNLARSLTAGHKAAGYHPGVQDRVHSAIDAEPPFLKFWLRLNEERAARGEGEAFYKEAKEAFLGGPTPVGALTFVGKEWDGVRAVPMKAYEGRKSYRGEFRQVSDNGTVWRTVHSSSGEIAYASPEAALAGALTAKNHSETHKS
jgi:hypothetical protein